ncbi:MAG TPA: hypothetical protein VMW70_16025 [Burkholderiales bacterium]|nr:hypothetical protein [Burkholderiales bacterium]
MREAGLTRKAPAAVASSHGPLPGWRHGMSGDAVKLFSESNEHPDLVFIKTASLDDPSVIEPKATPSAIEKRYRYSAVVQRPSRNVAELPAFDTRPKVS